jgi:hypothetical protein
LHKAGITTLAGIIIGNPDDTEEIIRARSQLPYALLKAIDVEKRRLARIESEILATNEASRAAAARERVAARVVVQPQTPEEAAAEQARLTAELEAELAEAAGTGLQRAQQPPPLLQLAEAPAPGVEVSEADLKELEDTRPNLKASYVRNLDLSNPEVSEATQRFLQMLDPTKPSRISIKTLEEAASSDDKIARRLMFDTPGRRSRAESSLEQPVIFAKPSTLRTAPNEDMKRYISIE